MGHAIPVSVFLPQVLQMKQINRQNSQLLLTYFVDWLVLGESMLQLYNSGMNLPSQLVLHSHQ